MHVKIRKGGKLSVLKKYLEKLDIKTRILVLSLTTCKKETYLTAGMQINLRLFVKSQMQLKLNNSNVHSNFNISELYLST